MAQRTKDGRLTLTPNNGFFPKLGLTAGGSSDTEDVGGLNKGQMFAHVSGWDGGDAMEWGIWIERPGALRTRLNLEKAARGDPFLLSLDGASPRPAGMAAFRIEKAGLHTLRLEMSGRSAGAVRFRTLELSGPAATQAAVVRKRWRPAAAHTRFSSSRAEGDIRLWVMEMDAVPGELNFYSPMTTPFGYYGPTWLADGRVNASFNFSLWSYGRGKKEPPIEQLSHLIAIGNPTAKFSGFGHEGTGVKIRGWDPAEPGARRSSNRRTDSTPRNPTARTSDY